jgi:hypothetical protein
VPSRWDFGEGDVNIGDWTMTMIELPGVGEGGMPGWNAQ